MKDQISEFKYWLCYTPLRITYHGVVQENSVIDIHFLEKTRCLDSEYSRFNNFKSRVLDPSIKQINENTDITIKVEQIKQDVQLQGFHSDSNKVQPKVEQKTRRPETRSNTPDFFVEMTDAQRLLFTQII